MLLMCFSFCLFEKRQIRAKFSVQCTGGIRQREAQDDVPQRGSRVAGQAGGSAVSGQQAIPHILYVQFSK